ncbi:ABC transporter permease [Williamsia sp. MIQD14]|uniref:ABC transporter permease n=1 Tax=Williamsia sp. MIQD14 TaxID=3425703 RepID=UPI003DA12B9B
MTAVLDDRSSVGLVSASATLAGRKIRAAVRSGDATFALLSPAVFFLCFHTPLHRRFELGGGDYAQFLTPLILVQAGLFAAIAATESAGADARAGTRMRMMSMPISRLAPVVARMTWVSVRMVLSIAAGVAVGAVLGFRFDGSSVDTALFVCLLVAFAVSVSLLTDAVGTIVTGSAAVAGVLMIPQLILVMASTGLVPAEGFPGWAQPFVRNQPVSVLTDALRALAEGRDIDVVAIGLWSLGLFAAGVLAVSIAGRRQFAR